MQIPTCTYTHMFIHMSTHVHKRIPTHVDTHVYAHVVTQVYTHVQAHVHMHQVDVHICQKHMHLRMLTSVYAHASLEPCLRSCLRHASSNNPTPSSLNMSTQPHTFKLRVHQEELVALHLICWECSGLRHSCQRLHCCDCC